MLYTILLNLLSKITFNSAFIDEKISKSDMNLLQDNLKNAVLYEIYIAKIESFRKLLTAGFCVNLNELFFKYE